MTRTRVNDYQKARQTPQFTFPKQFIEDRSCSPVAVDAAVKQRLSSFRNETFVSFAVMASAVSIWAADDRGMRFHLGEASASEVVSAARQMQCLCASPNSSRLELDRFGRQLYRSLVQPIAYLLTAEREIHIHLADGFPWIPFGLLRTERSEYVADLYRFRFAKDFPWHQDRRGESSLGVQSRVLLVDSHPASSHPESSRQGCAAYLMHLANLMPANDMLCGQAATIERFAGLAPEAELLHIRCGVAMVERGVLLQLARGKKGIGLDDDSSVDCCARLFPGEVPADSLRGCQLAVMDIEWQGAETDPALAVGSSPVESPRAHALAQAMHTAGVSNLLLPLWGTGEPTRAAYFECLYNSICAGMSAQEAVRTAVDAIRANERWKHPHYWAAYQLSSLHNGHAA